MHAQVVSLLAVVFCIAVRFQAPGGGRTSSMEKEVVQKMQAILAKTLEEMAVSSKWTAIVDLLVEHKVAYTLKEVPPTEFLVHPQNRGKLGINAYNAHRNGSVIYKIGADLQLLGKATAFELSHEEGPRNTALNFNRQLVKDHFQNICLE